jgi:small-conductance mechanosensitive channel
MEDILAYLEIIVSDFRYLIAAGAYLLWLGVSWVLIKFFEDFVHRFFKKADTVVIKEARFPLWLILMIVGLFVVARTVGLPPKVLPYVDRFTQLSVIFMFVYFIVRLFINFIEAAGRRNRGLRNMVPTFSRIINIFIWGIGIIMLMDIFGISITPLMASLGIAGIAIGLALQDTLSNFFSGIYILMSQPVHLGDYVELENGLKGYITNIGWRETRIRTLPNNRVVIPNAKLSQSVLTNYHMPQPEMACLVQVGVSYNSDLEKVEKVTIEVSKEVLERVPGGIKTFQPFIRYHTFNDFSIDFTVILRVAEFVDKYLVTHEFVKALHKRYKKEGIEIPFPIRTVYTKKES